MLRLALLTITIFFCVSGAQADCRGCCSHHGGVTCVDQVTQCWDGSSLSAKCSAKGCNKCGSIAKPKKKITENRSQGYDRKAFRHWIDEDGDCQDTRAEVLILTSEVKPKFKGDKECVVVSGKWTDPYSGTVIYKASEVDVDHIVPLKHSYEAGASEWTPKRREQFANDVVNLIPVSAKLNRQKGAKSPTEWMPPSKDYHCEYLQKWTTVKSKYQLKEEPKRSPASVTVEQMKAAACERPAVKAKPKEPMTTEPKLQPTPNP